MSSKFEQRFDKHIFGNPNENLTMGQTKMVLEREGIHSIDHATTEKIYYNGKISRSEDAQKYLKNFLNGRKQSIAIAADTGAGKTYWVANAFKNNSHETYEGYDGFYGKKNLNILCVPNRNQAIQAGLDYQLPYIVGGIDITTMDFYNQQGFIIVYDKITEVLRFIRDKQDIIKDFKINLIIDEAHNLIEAEYRPLCIENIIECMKQVLELNGNVALMSASFEILDFFEYSTIVGLFDTNEEESKTTTQIIHKLGNHNTDTFVAKEVYEEIKKGNIAYVRYQKKDREDAGLPLTGIVQEIERNVGRPITFYCINSDQKEMEQGKFVNDAMECLIKDSVLPAADVYFCTSMVDAGTNIIGIVDENGKVTQPTNIVPMYVLDANSCSINSIEQSFNRIRWSVDSRKILLCGEYAKDPIHFGQLFREEIRLAKGYQKANNAFFDIIKEVDTLENAINNTKMHLLYMLENSNTANKCLFFNEETNKVEIEYLDLYRQCRKKYMQQFLDISILKQELLRVLGGNVVVYYIEAGNDIDVKIDVNAARIQLLSDVANDKERYLEFDKQQGKDWELIKDTEFATLYKKIRREESIKDTLLMLATSSKKDIVSRAKEVDKNLMQQLNKVDTNVIQNKLLNNKYLDVDYNVNLVIDVLESTYRDELKLLTYLFKDASKAISTITTNSDDKIREIILVEQAKETNQCYLKQLKPCNKFQKEQYEFIDAVEKVKGTNKTLTISKVSKSFDALVEILGEKTTYNKIAKLSKRIYKTKSSKDSIIIYDLK